MLSRQTRMTKWIDAHLTCSISLWCSTRSRTQSCVVWPTSHQGWKSHIRWSDHENWVDIGNIFCRSLLSKSSIQKWVIQPYMYGLDAAINRTQHLAHPGDRNAYIAPQNIFGQITSTTWNNVFHWMRVNRCLHVHWLHLFSPIVLLSKNLAKLTRSNMAIPRMIILHCHCSHCLRCLGNGLFKIHNETTNLLGHFLE